MNPIGLGTESSLSLKVAPKEARLLDIYQRGRDALEFLFIMLVLENCIIILQSCLLVDFNFQASHIVAEREGGGGERKTREGPRGPPSPCMNNNRKVKLFQ